jgi:NADH-quinone oxidoreductase subunit H
MRELFYFVVFPGILFSGIAGGVLCWFDRKITARLQFRKGPPLLQPFYDFVKLMGKELILPKRGSAALFLLSPLLSLCGAALAGLMILLPIFGLETGFQGDLIVIFYLLAMPSVFTIAGALASGNPLAAVGASREIKLVIAYELSFILFMAAVIYKSDMQLSLQGVLAYQSAHGAHLASVSGVLLFVVFLFCLQAKLGLVPFDMAEAETEITHGLFIEYSGPAYGLYKLTKYMLWFLLPCLGAGTLVNGLGTEGTGLLWSALKILGIVLLLTLIRNTNPRLKIRQAMRFFFIWMNLLVIAALLLSVFGL